MEHQDVETAPVLKDDHIHIPKRVLAWVLIPLIVLLVFGLGILTGWLVWGRGNSNPGFACPDMAMCVRPCGIAQAHNSGMRSTICVNPGGPIRSFGGNRGGGFNPGGPNVHSTTPTTGTGAQ